MTSRWAACALLITLAGCQKSAPVRLVSFTGAEPPLIAQKLGYLKGVDLQETASSARAMEALLAGSADVMVGTYEQALMIQAQGKDVVALRLLSECHCLALVAVPAKGQIPRLEGFNGKAIGVAGPGGPMQTFAEYVLGKVGAKASYAAIGVGATAAAAVEGGKVDAAVVLANTYVKLAERYGKTMSTMAETFTPEGSKQIFGVESYPAMALMARREWLDAHPAEAKQIADTMGQAVEWLLTHKPDEVKEKLGTGDPAAMRLYLPRYSKTGIIDLKSAAVVLEMLEKSGKVPAGRVRLEATLWKN